MTQISRDFTDTTDGFRDGKRLLIEDRSSILQQSPWETLAATGLSVVRLAARLLARFKWISNLEGQDLV